MSELFKFIKIPIKALEQSGVDNTKPMQFYAHDGAIIITNVNEGIDTGFECDLDCNNCPLSNMDCGNENKKEEEKS